MLRKLIEARAEGRWKVDRDIPTPVGRAPGPPGLEPFPACSPQGQGRRDSSAAGFAVGFSGRRIRACRRDCRGQGPLEPRHALFSSVDPGIRVNAQPLEPEERGAAGSDDRRAGRYAPADGYANLSRHAALSRPTGEIRLHRRNVARPAFEPRLSHLSEAGRRRARCGRLWFSRVRCAIVAAPHRPEAAGIAKRTDG